ncbi:MAG: glycosyltransferase family 2 protein [bacterium]
MNSPFSVGAVIVTWNSVSVVGKALESLMKQTYPLDKIVVVDNFSHDGTVEYIKMRFPRVEVIALDRNRGFAHANNIGIEQLNSDWVLTLNPDAYLEPNWVEILLNFVCDHPRAGILGGILLRYKSHQVVIDSAGIILYSSRRPQDRYFDQPFQSSVVHTEKVWGICAAAALYRREMLTEVAVDNEVFPIKFFAYLEDVDLAWRAWNKGWETWFVPSAVGWHLRGGSPVSVKFSRYFTFRNRWWLILRNDSFSALLKDIPYILGFEVMRIGLLIRYPYLWKAFKESLLGLRWALKTRYHSSHAPLPITKGLGLNWKDIKVRLSNQKWWR